MATLDDVRRIASELPGAFEGEGDPFGFGVEVKGKVKGFVWTWMERVEPNKPRVANPSVLAISTPGLGAKEILMSSEPDKYVVDPHYNGYPAVLARIESFDSEELQELVIEAWRCKAPRPLVIQFDQSLKDGSLRSEA